jgi:hypothetical protein
VWVTGAPAAPVTGAPPSPKSTEYVNASPHELVAPSVLSEVTNGASPLVGDGVLPAGKEMVSCRSMAPRSGRVPAPVPVSVSVSATSGSSAREAPLMSVVSSPGASASAESMRTECSFGAVRDSMLSPSMSWAPCLVASRSAAVVA